MRFIAVVFLVAFASVMHAEDAKPLVAKELAEFLGPESPQAFRWTKDTMIDFDLYNGEAIPPLSGHVGFYLGGHPQELRREPGSTTVKGRLGIFPVKWLRTVLNDGSISQRALVYLDDYWHVDIWISAKRQADLDRLIVSVSQLPTFTKKPKPFRTQ